jgi:competence protein ComEC
VNLDRVLQTLQPSQIIADGSNYRSYVSRWSAAAEKQKIPFHYTGEKGFYTIYFKDEN